MMKRVMSVLLILVMLTGMLPVFAQAQNEPTTAVDNGDMTVQGTNGFGDLLAEDITQAQESMEEQAAAGYTLTDLEITGNTATVTYDSLEEATVVVAIYTEDGMQLLTSGKATVVPEETTATVTIDGEMPQYFMASAYLLDSYDMSPLCPAYDSPLYTKEMQDLLASTAEDYDPDRVLQLEESPETNFAVYAETTKVIEQVEGVNTVSSVDEATNTYVFEDADERITSLQIGDVFVFPYAENEILIVKVSSIRVDGSTVTITGSDVDIEEVFSYVKIEAGGTTEDIRVDTSTADEGVTFEGVVDGSPGTYAARAYEGGFGAEKSLSFSIFKEFETDDQVENNGDFGVNVKITVAGTFEMSVNAGVNYYISLKSQYIEFKTEMCTSLNISATGEIELKLGLGTFPVLSVAGINIVLKPAVELKFSGSFEYGITSSFVVGFSFDTDNYFQNLSTTPQTETYLEIEGEVFFGIDLCPEVNLISSSVVSLELSVPVGLQLDAVKKGTGFENDISDPKEKHACTECLDIEVSLIAKLEITLQFLSCDWLKFQEKFEKKLTICYMHYSFDFDDFGFGKCPYMLYRITFNVEDDNGAAVPNVGIACDANNELGKTNSKGIFVTYLAQGEYNFSALVNGKTAEAHEVIDEATKVVISPSSVDNGNSTLKIPGILGTVETHKLVDYGTNQVGFNNHKYVLFHEAMTWKDAEQYCEELGGHLVTITSSDEHYAVVQLLTKYGRKNCYWIGLSRDYVGASWNWITGETLSFAKWAENEPNNHDGEDELYVHVFGKKYTGGSGTKYVGDWNDTSNEGAGYANKFYSMQNFGFVCEFDDAMSNEHQITPFAIFPGDYSTEVTDTHTLKRASFSELVPHQEYVMFSLDSIGTEEVLMTDNLLFIDQAVADENGELTFQYVQRVNKDLSYVMVCGASNNDLNDAQITFPRMTADGESQIVQPVVVYDGKTLIEGQDYLITGDVDFAEAGEYTCYIRGIYNYTGLVTCTYQVRDVVQPTLTLKSPTLEFKDMITVNAFYTAENTEDVVEMGMITYSSQVTKWSVDTAEHVIPGATYNESTGRYVSSSQGIHAKYLGDTVYLACYAKLTDGSYVYTKLAPYSPVQYATNQLKNSTDTKLKQLVAAMLNYGAEAQKFFGHNTENLANATLTAEQIALPESYRSDMVSTVASPSADKQGEFVNNKGFAKRYPSISFEGAFCINYFFTPNYAPEGGITLYYWNAADFEAAAVLTAENASGSFKLEGSGISQYSGNIEGIAAKSLSQAVYVAAVYSDGTTTWTSGVLGYSIGAYCSSQASKIVAVSDLAMATAVYGYHAKQYFG